MSENIKASQVHDIVRTVMRSFGQPIVPDLTKSHGCYLHDSLGNREILDMFSFFATNALGHNHPALTSDKEFKEQLLIAALSNPSNSDFYTVSYAKFINTFRKIAMPKAFVHAFFISGGTLAVENALKVAMDWKVKKNYAKGMISEKGHQVIHFREAFHGRSGYTLSLTNTKPVDTRGFTKFQWPRIDNPKIHFPLNESSKEDVAKREAIAIEQIKDAIHREKDDICAIVIEPIQSEGGDNHFRPEFLKALRTLCDDNELLLIFDEVQTGVGLTGKFWAYENFGVTPDILAFGKKMQTCGIIATKRIDEVQPNCFTEEGRINSTWGGSLADMVHGEAILRVIDHEKLVDNAALQGEYLLLKLNELYSTGKVTNVRGRGLQCAFDLQDTVQRDKLITGALSENLLLLGAGPRSIRFRPPLVITRKEINQAISIIKKLLA
jgi:L-lysine 6-transaminase